MGSLKQMICPECKTSSMKKPLGIIGIVFLLLGLAGFCAMIPEIRRYLRLERM